MSIKNCKTRPELVEELEIILLSFLVSFRRLHNFFIENLLSRFAGSGEARKIGNWKLKIGIIALLFFIWCDYASAFTITTPTKNKVGLVGHWTFDGQDMLTGTVRDVSGNNNHGSMVNMATATARVAGKVGQGLAFDGVDDVVSAGDIALAENTTQITVAAWVKPSVANTGTIPIVNKARGTEGFAGWNLNRQSDETYRFWVTEGSIYPVATSDSVYADTNWHHVVGTYNGVEVKIYVDGVSADSSSNPATLTIPDVARSVCIGYANGNDPTCTSGVATFPGTIDDVRIYSRALSASEIQALYKMGEGTKTATTPSAGRGQAPSGCKSGLSCGLVGHWTFDGQDMLTGTVRDVSGNNNHGSMVNMATATSRTKGKVGQALKFDGVDDRINILHSASISPSEITIAFWMFPPTDFLAGKRIIDKGVTEYLVRRVAPGNGNKIEFFPGGYTSQNAVLQGRWTHVTITASASGHRMYLNGNLDFSNAIAYSPSGTGPLRIGGSTDFFPGDLDDVRIYNRVLSPSEIQALYKMGEGTKTATTPSAGRGQAPSGCTSGLSCGLVGHWTFDGQDMLTGTVRDVSGNNNHGSMVNMATATSRTKGKVGQALKFDGTDDYIKVTNSSSLTNYSKKSVFMWIYPTADVSKDIFSNGYWTSPFGDLFQKLTNAGRSQIYLKNDAGTTAASAFLSTPLNQWTHIGYAWDGTTVNYYLNGQIADTPDSFTGTLSGTGANVFIGGRGTAAFFPGTIDDVRIYNRALSVQEIQQLYNMGR